MIKLICAKKRGAYQRWIRDGIIVVLLTIQMVRVNI
jgi:hypothetical protein